MLIGELARQTGASPKAIRLYEARGLLPQVPRKGSYRVYTEKHLRQVQVIRQAQALGFTLSELAPALHGEGDEPDWLRLLKQLDRKRTAINKDICALKQLEIQLEQIEMDIRLCLAEAPDSRQPSCKSVTLAISKKSPAEHP